MLFATLKHNRIWSEVIGNTFYVKALFLIFMILQSCIYVSDFLGPLTKILLLYGVVIFVYDLLTEKNALHNRYKWLLIMFCGFIGLSVAVNFQQGLFANTKTFLYLLFEFFVIAMVPLRKEKKEVVKEYLRLSYIAIGLLFVISLISLYTFIMQIQLPLPGHANSFIGMSPDHRLFGISGNPNKLGIQMIVLLFLSITCFVLHTSKKRWFLILPVLTGIICLMLSGSRGAQVGFAFGFFFFVFFCVMYWRKTDLSWLVAVRSLVISFLIFVAFWGVAISMQYVVGFAPSVVNNLVATEEVVSEQVELEVTEESGTRVETDRVYSDATKNGSGRLILWETALKIFQHHPVFGVGNASVYRYGTEYMGGIQMNGFSQGNVHNLYLQILASSGIFAFLSFLILIGYFFIKGLKLLILNLRLKSPDAIFFISIFCGVLMILTHQMFERQMIYLQSLISVWFALYLGYYQYLLQKEEDDDDSY